VRPPWIRPFLALLVLALAALAPAASAGATTYCVAKPGCAGIPKSSLQEALDAALVAGPDRIEIGPTVGDPAPGGSYLSSDPLEVQGAGRAVTQLGGAGTVLTLGQGYGSPSVTVSDLTIVVQGPERTGLRLDGARADHVDVHGDPAVPGSVGVELRSGATFQRGTVTLPAANAIGIWTRLGTSRVDDSVVDLGSGPSAGGIFVENPDGETPVILDAQHVTIAGGGASGQVGATAKAVGSGQTVVLNLRNSIVSGVAHALSRAAPTGSVNVNPTYSNFDPAGNVDSGGTGGIAPSPTNTNLGPAFVNAAAHDFRLSPASPLIDAAQPGNLEPGDPANDLAGTRRMLDGSGDCSPRRDMGAFELLPGSVTARATAGPQAATTNQRITFDASASCDPDPTAGIGSYSWSFDEGGPATGAVVPRSFGKPGVHSATLTVTSSAGRTGSVKVSVTVSSPPKKPRKPRRSFVLIQARSVTVTSNGVASIPLRCSGTRSCTGRLQLTAARPVSKSVGKLIVKLGSTTFTIRRNHAKKVKIRLSPARRALLKEFGRLRTVVTVRDRDSAGRPRRSTRAITLRASPR
jgi:hypothetical protein